MPRGEQIPIIREKKKRNRSSRKLLVLLFLFFIILLVILFFNSSISRISTIEIEGNRHLTEEQIRQASQVQVGDHFFAAGARSIEDRVKRLKIAEGVEVIKSFPGHITIKVKEYPEVAFQITPKAGKEALLANGTSVAIRNKEIVIDKPILTGWDPDDTLRLELCQVLAGIPQELLADISEIKPDPSEAFSDKIKIYTRSRFEVSTTVSFFPEKIEYMRSIIAENEPGYITMLLADHYSKDKPPIEEDLEE